MTHPFRSFLTLTLAGLVLAAAPAESQVLNSIQQKCLNKVFLRGSKVVKAFKLCPTSRTYHLEVSPFSTRVANQQHLGSLHGLRIPGKHYRPINR